MDNDILLEFKRQALLFIDELIGQFPNEGDLLLLRLFINNKSSLRDNVIKFSDDINKDNKLIKKMIQDRNELFFIQTNLFNPGTNMSRQNKIRDIWTSGLLDPDDKEIMWKWIDTFVYLCDRYITTTKSFK